MNTSKYNKIKNTYLHALASEKPEAAYLAYVYSRVHEKVKHMPLSSADSFMATVGILFECQRDANAQLAQAISEEDTIFIEFHKSTLKVLDSLI